MKKLLLVQPTTTSTLDFVNYSSSVIGSVLPLLPDSILKKNLNSKKAVNVPTLSTMILSALTPRDQFEVEFIDEKIESINYDSNPDLVAITSNTTIINRAYEIAGEFRKRGTKVVLGGVHASILPEEVSQHVDAVAIGEAEYIWQDILNDFLRGNLKERYQADKFVDMSKDYVLPDNSILKRDFYLTDTSIELSRGCPHKCTFCSDSVVYGSKYRVRDIDQVIAQIEQTESDYLFFADDNVIGKPKFAKELLGRLAKKDKRWIGSASTILAENKELTDLVIESGCKFLIVGFESTSPESLMQIGKKQNLKKDYGDFVRYLQDNGVVVASCFILGFENDSVQSIREQHQYAQDQGMLFYMPGVLTPYPGTPLFDGFKESDRLLHQDWSKYNVRGGIPVFSGRNHTDEYLKELASTVKTNGVHYFLKQLQNHPELIEKFIN